MTPRALRTFRISGAPILAALALAIVAAPARADIEVPSDGSDGVFAPTQNVEIDLGRAVTGVWSQPGTGVGVYDPAQWAIVFKYASVNIPAGVTVTFRNHPKNPPVVWLVQGDVTIAGTVNLSGQNGQPAPNLAVPGPGGFAGGSGFQNPLLASAGHGPGGGRVKNPNYIRTTVGGSFGIMGGAWYGLQFGQPGPIYSNAALIPLIGGSGGASGIRDNGEVSPWGSGAGGGAILIASRRTLSIMGSGRILAHGGTTSWAADRESGGSGGGIRLVAERLTGNGTVRADGGYNAGNGRLRFDVASFDAAFNTSQAPHIAYLGTEPPVIWPQAGHPRIWVSTVAGAPVPADPSAQMFPGLADLDLPDLGAVPVVIEAANVPLDWTIELRVVPRYGPDVVVNATRTTGDANASSWRAEVAFPRGVSAVYVRAASPQGSPPARPGR